MGEKDTRGLSPSQCFPRGMKNQWGKRKRWLLTRIFGHLHLILIQLSYFQILLIQLSDPVFYCWSYFPLSFSSNSQISTALNSLTLFSTISWDICLCPPLEMQIGFELLGICELILSTNNSEHVVLAWTILPPLNGIFFVEIFLGITWTTFQVNWLVLACSCKALRRGLDSNQKHKIQLCANSYIMPVTNQLVSFCKY